MSTRKGVHPPIKQKTVVRVSSKALVESTTTDRVGGMRRASKRSLMKTIIDSVSKPCCPSYQDQAYFMPLFFARVDAFQRK